jgi:hypothetical protein
MLGGYPLDNITRPAGTCARDSDCSTASGQVCDMAEPVSACRCSSATGEDSCRALGRCVLSPQSRCQQCLSAMQGLSRAALGTRQSPSAIASNFRCGSVGNVHAGQCLTDRHRAGAMVEASSRKPHFCRRSACALLAPVAGYDASTACGFIASSYITSLGSSGYFGLRPGALCATLGQCASLPADTLLRSTGGAPLQNITGALDACSAEGIAGGTALSGVTTAATGAVGWQQLTRGQQQATGSRA